jgi:hypothetical protein
MYYVHAPVLVSSIQYRVPRTAVPPCRLPAVAQAQIEPHCPTTPHTHTHTQNDHAKKAKKSGPAAHGYPIASYIYKVIYSADPTHSLSNATKNQGVRLAQRRSKAQRAGPTPNANAGRSKGTLRARGGGRGGRSCGAPCPITRGCP